MKLKVTKGMKYGRLIPIALAGKNKFGHVLWWCLCDCEEYILSTDHAIARGHSKSCGCLNRDKLRGKVGKGHPMWRNSRNYFTIHKWVRYHKAKIQLCECCGEVKPHDCANISGEYKRDIDDYEWLCRRCHQTKDGRMDFLKSRPRDALGRFV